jgi:L-lysine 6-transaminase
MTTSAHPRIAPADVHAVLARHILADGFDLVFDFEKSHGSWIHDSRGNREILDFASFFASNPIGYNHPGMTAPDFLATLHRVAQLKPALPDVYSVEYAQFVERFGRLAKPPEMRYAFFVEGGALGVENALKVAFDWKVRRNQAKGVPGEKGAQILHFREAFHGRSGYTLSLTNTDPRKTDYFPKFKWPRITNPKRRFPATEEGEREVAAEEERARAEIAQAFADHPDDIAAILVEPIQAEGGDNHFRAEFLQALQATARARQALFIVDEVQTGVGLTGKMWAYEHFGLQPDVLAFGKKTQVCGCMAGPRVDEEPENVFKTSSRINSTFGGNLTDMVRFGRFLEIIHEERLVENARVTGEHLLTGLREVERESGGKLGSSRGRGLMIACDLPTPEIRDEMQRRLLANGLLLLKCGVRSIRFRPPLNLTAADADRGLEIVRRTIKEL